MSDEIEFVEASVLPVCPHCNTIIQYIEYRRQKLSFGLMSGFAWVIILSCPQCHRVLGTQSDG